MSAIDNSNIDAVTSVLPITLDDSYIGAITTIRKHITNYAKIILDVINRCGLSHIELNNIFKEVNEFEGYQHQWKKYEHYAASSRLLAISQSSREFGIKSRILSSISFAPKKPYSALNDELLEFMNKARTNPCSACGYPLATADQTNNMLSRTECAVCNSSKSFVEEMRRQIKNLCAKSTISIRVEGTSQRLVNVAIDRLITSNSKIVYAYSNFFKDLSTATFQTMNEETEFDDRLKKWAVEVNYFAQRIQSEIQFMVADAVLETSSIKKALHAFSERNQELPNKLFESMKTEFEYLQTEATEEFITALSKAKDILLQNVNDQVRSENLRDASLEIITNLSDYLEHLMSVQKKGENHPPMQDTKRNTTTLKPAKTSPVRDLESIRVLLTNSVLNFDLQLKLIGIDYAMTMRDKYQDYESEKRTKKDAEAPNETQGNIGADNEPSSGKEDTKKLETYLFHLVDAIYSHAQRLLKYETESSNSDLCFHHAIGEQRLGVFEAVNDYLEMTERSNEKVIHVHSTIAFSIGKMKSVLSDDAGGDLLNLKLSFAPVSSAHETFQKDVEVTRSKVKIHVRDYLDAIMKTCSLYTDSLHKFYNGIAEFRNNFVFTVYEKFLSKQTDADNFTSIKGVFDRIKNAERTGPLDSAGTENAEATGKPIIVRIEGNPDMAQKAALEETKIAFLKEVDEFQRRLEEITACEAEEQPNSTKLEDAKKRINEASAKFSAALRQKNENLLRATKEAVTKVRNAIYEKELKWPHIFYKTLESEKELVEQLFALQSSKFLDECDRFTDMKPFDKADLPQKKKKIEEAIQYWKWVLRLMESLFSNGSSLSEKREQAITKFEEVVNSAPPVVTTADNQPGDVNGQNANQKQNVDKDSPQKKAEEAITLYIKALEKSKGALSVSVPTLLQGLCALESPLPHENVPIDSRQKAFAIVRDLFNTYLFQADQARIHVLEQMESLNSKLWENRNRNVGKLPKTLLRDATDNITSVMKEFTDELETVLDLAADTRKTMSKVTSDIESALREIPKSPAPNWHPKVNAYLKSGKRVANELKEVEETLGRSIELIKEHTVYINEQFLSLRTKLLHRLESYRILRSPLQKKTETKGENGDREYLGENEFLSKVEFQRQTVMESACSLMETLEEVVSTLGSYSFVDNEATSTPIQQDTPRNVSLSNHYCHEEWGISSLENCPTVCVNNETICKHCQYPLVSGSPRVNVTICNDCKFPIPPRKLESSTEFGYSCLVCSAAKSLQDVKKEIFLQLPPANKSLGNCKRCRIPLIEQAHDAEAKSKCKNCYALDRLFYAQKYTIKYSSCEVCEQELRLKVSYDGTKAFSLVNRCMPQKPFLCFSTNEKPCDPCKNLLLLHKARNRALSRVSCKPCRIVRLLGHSDTPYKSFMVSISWKHFQSLFAAKRNACKLLECDDCRNARSLEIAKEEAIAFRHYNTSLFRINDVSTMAKEEEEEATEKDDKYADNGSDCCKRCNFPLVYNPFRKEDGTIEDNCNVCNSGLHNSSSEKPHGTVEEKSKEPCPCCAKREQLRGEKHLAIQLVIRSFLENSTVLRITNEAITKNVDIANAKASATVSDLVAIIVEGKNVTIMEPTTLANVAGILKDPPKTIINAVVEYFILQNKAAQRAEEYVHKLMIKRLQSNLVGKFCYSPKFEKKNNELSSHPFFPIDNGLSVYAFGSHLTTTKYIANFWDLFRIANIENSIHEKPSTPNNRVDATPKVNKKGKISRKSLACACLGRCFGKSSRYIYGEKMIVSRKPLVREYLGNGSAELLQSTKSKEKLGASIDITSGDRTLEEISSLMEKLRETPEHTCKYSFNFETCDRLHRREREVSIDMNACQKCHAILNLTSFKEELAPFTTHIFIRNWLLRSLWEMEEKAVDQDKKKKTVVIFDGRYICTVADSQDRVKRFIDRFGSLDHLDNIETIAFLSSLHRDSSKYKSYVNVADDFKDLPGYVFFKSNYLDSYNGLLPQWRLDKQKSDNAKWQATLTKIKEVFRCIQQFLANYLDMRLPWIRTNQANRMSRQWLIVYLMFTSFWRIVCPGACKCVRRCRKNRVAPVTQKAQDNAPAGDSIGNQQEAQLNAEGTFPFQVIVDIPPNPNTSKTVNSRAPDQHCDLEDMVGLQFRARESIYKALDILLREEYEGKKSYAQDLRTAMVINVYLHYLDIPGVTLKQKLRLLDANIDLQLWIRHMVNTVSAFAPILQLLFSVVAAVASWYIKDRLGENKAVNDAVIFVPLGAAIAYFIASTIYKIFVEQKIITLLGDPESK